MSSTTTVSEVMTAKVVTVRPDQSLAEAADVLADHGIGAAPVVDGSGRLVGLLRDEDLLISESRLHLPTVISVLPGIDITLPGAARRYDEELQQAIASTVDGVMERTFVSLPPDASLEDLATAMHESEVTHVPIVENGRVVGIATRGDIVRHLAATT
jgi:CBS domain-containing protein